MTQKNNIFVAITGVSGSGKSTIMSILQKNHYNVFDFDLFSTQLISNDTTVRLKLESIIKENILNNNNLDFKKIGNFFEKHIELEILFENWFQPYLGEKIREKFTNNEFTGLIFFDVPFIEQKNIVDIFDYIWIVEVDYKVNFERIKKRNNYDDNKINYLINRSQISEILYNSSSTIIVNNKSIDYLENLLLSEILNFNLKSNKKANAK